MHTNIIAPITKNFLICPIIKGSIICSIIKLNIRSNNSFPNISLITSICVAKEKLFEVSPKSQFIAALEHPAQIVIIKAIIERNISKGPLI